MSRVLLIEDDADSRDMLAMLLEAGGYAVESAGTVADATHLLEQRGFGLVLTDLVLTSRNMDRCWEIIDAVTRLARPTPVGLITGWPVRREQAERHELAFILRKPCTRDAIFAQLAATLDLPALSPAIEVAVRAYFRGLEDHAYEALRELTTPDVVYRLPGADSRFATEVRGRDAFLAFTARTFEEFTTPRFELGTIQPLPHGALVEYVGAWHEGAVERRMPGAVMFQFEHGLIARIEVRANMDELR